MTKQLQDYVAAYQKLHAGETGYLVEGKEYKPNHNLFDGSNFTTKLFGTFSYVMRKFDSVRVLDYGCGKANYLYKPVFAHGTLFQEFPGKIQSIYCYDPGFERFSKPFIRGSKFDVIICADVMEHVPEEEITTTLCDMAWSLAPNGVALFTIAGRPAKKQFLDGENLHISVKPLDYWIKTMESVFAGMAVYMLYEGEHGDEVWTSQKYEQFHKD